MVTVTLSPQRKGAYAEGRPTGHFVLGGRNTDTCVGNYEQAVGATVPQQDLMGAQEAWGWWQTAATPLTSPVGGGVGGQHSQRNHLGG